MLSKFLLGLALIGAGAGVVFAAQPGVAPEPHAPRLTVSVGNLVHDFAEDDPLEVSADGVLVREHGHVVLRKLEVAAMPASFPLPLRFRAVHAIAHGATRYQGYLQQGTSFTPLSSTTRNRFTDTQVSVGYRHRLSQLVHLEPEIEVGRGRWKRDLGQYIERYRRSTFGMAALLEVRAMPQLLLAAQLGAGQVRSNTVIPALGFNESLGTSHYWRGGLSGQYQLHRNWSIGVDFSRTEFHTDASAVSHGLLIPSARTAQTSATLQIAFQF